MKLPTTPPTFTFHRVALANVMILLPYSVSPGSGESRLTGNNGRKLWRTHNWPFPNDRTWLGPNTKVEAWAVTAPTGRAV